MELLDLVSGGEGHQIGSERYVAAVEAAGVGVQDAGGLGDRYQAIGAVVVGEGSASPGVEIGAGGVVAEESAASGKLLQVQRGRGCRELRGRAGESGGQAVEEVAVVADGLKRDHAGLAVERCQWAGKGEEGVGSQVLSQVGLVVEQHTARGAAAVHGDDLPHRGGMIWQKNGVICEQRDAQTAGAAEGRHHRVVVLFAQVERDVRGIEYKIGRHLWVVEAAHVGQTDNTVWGEAGSRGCKSAGQRRRCNFHHDGSRVGLAGAGLGR